MEPLIITASICGAEVTKEHNPAVPYTVEEIGREALSAYRAGASIIHLHVREDDGTPTQSYDRFKACMEEIYRLCPPELIVQPSTGGATGMSAEERLQPLRLNPEMATLDCGTLNFGGDEIFVNTENMIIEFARQMMERNVKPEVEVFDKGMIDLAKRLNARGQIPGPMHFNLVLGVNGGISAEPRDLLFMVESLPADSTYTATGIGRAAFPIATMAMILGGHVRVGFEDNVYLARGLKAQSNGELVEKVVRIAKELGREIATPQQAREILGLNPK
ncbi:MAG: 3-keto-5-aminohexanoate cleavage protein [Firmicutes bacterium]|jgi:3-keto-5-aminohexanoate cleavage enzyme|nr:3-keto-5-aminohexanoate cleavage protein [Bacillota bacterium]